MVNYRARVLDSYWDLDCSWDHFPLICSDSLCQSEYYWPEGGSKHQERDNYQEEDDPEPVVLEDDNDVHKEGEGTDYGEKVEDEPGEQKPAYLKDGTKTAKQVGNKKD